jgi:hypothetical protein
MTTMAKRRITMGLPYHPSTRALIDAEIGIDGYELDIETLNGIVIGRSNSTGRSCDPSGATLDKLEKQTE